MTEPDFIKIVKTAMYDQNVTTGQLARLLKGRVARSTLYEWLDGKHRLPDDKLAVVLDILGIDNLTRECFEYF